jgi:hypothetical protein
VTLDSIEKDCKMGKNEAVPGLLPPVETAGNIVIVIVRARKVVVANAPDPESGIGNAIGSRLEEIRILGIHAQEHGLRAAQVAVVARLVPEAEVGTIDPPKKLKD